MYHHPSQNLRPIHPPKVANLETEPSNARPIKIPVKDPLDHEAPAILHEPPPDFHPGNITHGAAVVLISGAGGGVSGPSGIYLPLAEKLASLLSIPCIRLDYREPAQTQFCTADILACFDYLGRQFSSSRFVLVGWSFGGSPCFTVAGKRDAREQVRGIATVASQTAGTAGIKKMNPRPVLLMHGLADSCLSPECSRRLYREYGSGGQAQLHLFEGDDHGLSGNAVKVEKMIFDFTACCLGFEDLLQTDEQLEELAGRDLVESKTERVREMETGHDLEGGETL